MEVIINETKTYIDEDQYKWFDWEFISISKNGYLTFESKEGYFYPIHQMIKGKAPKGLVIDHINRNKLDNRRDNLRFISQKENIINPDRWDKIQEKKLEKDVDRLMGLGLV